MVTHDINEATSMSDRILIVQKPGEKEDKNTQIININNPRSDFKNVKYNELIKNSIFKESSIKTL